MNQGLAANDANSFGPNSAILFRIELSQRQDVIGVCPIFVYQWRCGLVMGVGVWGW
jgi:hypothetical protein